MSVIKVSVFGIDENRLMERTYYQIKCNNEIHHNHHYILQPFELTSYDGESLGRKYPAKDDRLPNNSVI